MKENRTETFALSISPDAPKEAWDAVNDFLNGLQDAYYESVRYLAEELGVSEDAANDIQYLRSRSRWTPELEEELIRLHREGTRPNIFEFGN